MTVPPTPAQSLEKIAFINVDAEEVPPCGVMQVTGSVVEEGVMFLTCARAAATFSAQYAVNGLVRVAAGAKGICYRRGDLPVAFDAGSPQAGEGWGLKPGQWTLAKGFPGGTVVGVVDAANKIALVTLESPIARLLVKTTSPVEANTETSDYRIYVGSQGAEDDGGWTTVPAAVSRFSFGSNVCCLLTRVDNGWELRPAANHCYAVTLGASVADGASTIVTLSDGRSVSAVNRSGATLEAGNAIAILDMATGIYMLTGAGSSEFEIPPNIFHGTAVDTTVPGGAGTVTIASGAVEAVNQGPITYFAGDALSVYEESGTYYAVPAGTQIFAMQCPSPGVNAGATINVTLPDGRTVSATNVARTKLFTDSWMHVYLDRSDATWKILRTDDFLRRRVKGLINMAAGLKGTDASATVDNISTLDGSSAPTITTAANTLKLWGNDNDVVILEEETFTGGASSWFVASIQPAARVPRRFKCQLNGALHKADATATIDTVTALDGGSAPAPTTAANYLRWAGNDNDPCFIIEDWSSGSVAYILEAVAWDVATPVTDVDVSGTALRQTKQDFIGKANAAAASPATIDAGTSCPS